MLSTIVLHVASFTPPLLPTQQSGRHYDSCGGQDALDADIAACVAASQANRDRTSPGLERKARVAAEIFLLVPTIAAAAASGGGGADDDDDGGDAQPRLAPKAAKGFAVLARLPTELQVRGGTLSVLPLLSYWYLCPDNDDPSHHYLFLQVEVLVATMGCHDMDAAAVRTMLGSDAFMDAVDSSAWATARLAAVSLCERGLELQRASVSAFLPNDGLWSQAPQVAPSLFLQMTRRDYVEAVAARIFRVATGSAPLREACRRRDVDGVCRVMNTAALSCGLLLLAGDDVVAAAAEDVLA